MTLKGTNQEFGRPYNRRIVLEAIRLYGPTTRAEISRRVGLTIQTVSTIIRELEEQALVLARREEPKGRGLPAASLAINPEGGFAVGVHVSPLGIEAGLVNLAGDVVARRGLALAHSSPEAAFAEIGPLVEALVAQRPGGRIFGAGLAMPGPFDVESMSFVGPTTMEGWKGFPIRQRLADITGLPAFLEVDLAAAALGERLYGSGAAFKDFYYLYFGVGLGGCMVHDGTPMRGAYGNAGEIGHIQAVPNGDLCPCGNRGCLERYVSLEAYERASRVIDPDRWVADVAPIFRAALITIENLFDPETIILGGLGEELLLHKLVAAVANLPNSVSARQGRSVARVIASDGGEEAVLRGAAALVVSGVLSPRFGQMFVDGAARIERDPMMLDRPRRAS